MEPNENQDAPEVLETPESEEETPSETPEQTDEEKEQLRKQLADLESKNKQLFERLKKVEKAPVKSEEGLSNKDILFLAKTDIHEEDLDDVLDWAKFKGISIQDAYRQMKPTLDVKLEQRRTAAVTSTKGGAKTRKDNTGEDVLRRVEQTGEAPKMEELRALAEARFQRRISQNSRRGQ